MWYAGLLIVALSLQGCVAGPRLAPSLLHALVQDPERIEASEPQEDEPPETQSGYEAQPNLGGPESVQAELEADDEVRISLLETPLLDYALRSWFDLKRQLNEGIGLQIGPSYTALYQHANADLAGMDEGAAGGVFQLRMNWEALWRDTDHSGNVVFRLDHRHGLGTDVVPGFLHREIGSATPTALGYTDFGAGIMQLHWKQNFRRGRGVALVGRLQPFAYVDTYPLASTWTGFLNQSFSYNPTIATPLSGFGLAGGSVLGEHPYVLASLTDASGDHTESGFDRFFEDQEYFTHVELGWAESGDDLRANNVHVTAWHADAREKAQRPEGWGGSVSANALLDEVWMPFLRAGYSWGGASRLEAMVSTGFGWRVTERDDLIGLGLSWGKPPESPARDQYTAELFYRFQLVQHVVITPDFQLILDPAHNPGEDVIYVVGVRARLSL